MQNNVNQQNFVGIKESRTGPQLKTLSQISSGCHTVLTKIILFLTYNLSQLKKNLGCFCCSEPPLMLIIFLFSQQDGKFLTI